MQFLRDYCYLRYKEGTDYSFNIPETAVGGGLVTGRPAGRVIVRFFNP
jgi:hypothetical protein